MDSSSPSTFSHGTVNWLSGLAGGTAQVLVGHPFDTIKVRMQTSKEHKSAIECVKRTLATESIGGLYKGILSPLLGIGFCNAVLFSANGTFRKLLTDNEGEALSLARIAVAGSMAGGAMAVVNCPIELVKVRLQIQNPSSTKLVRWAALYLVTKAEGVAGLYRGFGITLLRELPSFAGYFFIYEGSKRMISSLQSKHESDLTSFELLLCGGMAGFGAWLPCYPQDVIKSRIQSSQSKLTIVGTARLIMAETGFKGFLRGFGPTMARAFPANAATFFAYEFVHKRLSAI